MGKEVKVTLVSQLQEGGWEQAGGRRGVMGGEEVELRKEGLAWQG